MSPRFDFAMLLTVAVSFLGADVARYAPEILGAVVALILLSAGALYVRQLNERHARLLAHLETELAEKLKAEDALKASEGFYHSLVESLPAAILRKDLEGRF